MRLASLVAIAATSQILQQGTDSIRTTSDILITSYGLLPKLMKRNTLNSWKGLAIVDESHMLKSRKSQRSTNVVKLLKAAKGKVLLSGTPAFARPEELFTQLSLVSGGEGDYKTFTDWEEVSHVILSTFDLGNPPSPRARPTHNLFLTRRQKRRSLRRAM